MIDNLYNLRIFKMNLNRRKFVKGAAISTAALSTPMVLRRAYAAEPLKVSSYGGYFEDSLKEYIYPAFTKETGIEVRSLAQSSGSVWFASLRAGLQAGQPATDVTMGGGIDVIRHADIFQALNESKLSNLSNVAPEMIFRAGDGKLSSVAVLAWYVTFVQNTDHFPDPITSWKDIWSDEFKDSIGWTEDINLNFILDITAVTFFGGQEILNSREGIEKVMNKAAELRKNVTLWYRDEGQFQQYLQSGEIPVGQYYNDVAGLMAADGFPVISVFPKEGGVIDYGSWSLLEGSDKSDAAHAFIDYCCDPLVQGEISRSLGTAPTVSQQAAGLSDEEFAAVSSPGKTIYPNFNIYVEHGDWLSERWSEIIAGG